MINFYSLSKKTTLLLAFTVLINEVNAQMVLWSNSITGTNPNTDNPYTTGDTYMTLTVTGSGIGRGSGINGANANNRYNANNWNSSSLDTSDYFYLTLKNDPLNTVGFWVTDFAFTSQASGTGPTSFSVRYSVDNFASDLGNTTNSGDSINLGSLYVVDSITFKIFAWGATSSSGTYSINDFTIYGFPPLAITFEKFDAVKNNNSAVLSWKLGGTSEGEKIGIQQSEDGKVFSTLAIVDQKTSSYIHQNPFKGINYYRLVALHPNGKISYTKVLSLNFSSSSNWTVYPNPAKEKLIIMGDDLQKISSVTVYDLTGTSVITTSNLYDNSISLEKVANGIYTVCINQKDGSITKQTFVVQK